MSSGQLTIIFLTTDSFYLVFQALHRRRNSAAPVHEGLGGEGMDRLYRGGAQQAAELHRVPHLFAGGGDEADGGGLGADHADGRLVGDDGGDGLGGGVPGDGDHVQTHRAHAGHGLQLVQVRAPELAAAIMPSSSLTGMKAPDRPPTEEEAMTPPFFTASLSRARAAVVPWVPQTSSPISSRMRATLSPTAGVGPGRSTMPKGVPRRRLASWATSWPMRVMRKAVFLMVSATTSKGWPFTLLEGVVHHAGGRRRPR